MGLLDKAMQRAAKGLADRAGKSGDDAATSRDDEQPTDPDHLPGAGAATSLTGDTLHDESDPGFAPIEGIGLEQYARITAQRNQGVALDDIYAEYGFDVSGWALVSDHWVGKLAADPQLAVEFEALVKAEEAKLA